MELIFHPQKDKACSSCQSRLLFTVVCLPSSTEAYSAKENQVLRVTAQHQCGYLKKLKRHRAVYTCLSATYATNVLRRKSISRAEVCLLYATSPTFALCPTDLLGEVFCPEVKRLS